MGLFELFGWKRAKATPSSDNFSEIREKARSLRQLERYQEAIPLLLEIADRDPIAISFLGNTYREAGDPVNARKWLLRGLEFSESGYLDDSLVNRAFASECHANLGEFEWSEGNRSQALEHLNKASQYWTHSDNERQEVARVASLSLISLSLMQKYIALEDYDNAFNWATQRLRCVPDCADAKEFMGAVERIENANVSIRVVLRLRTPTSPKAFQAAVLPFVPFAMDALSDRFGEAVSDFDLSLASKTPRALYSCTASNCDPVEVQNTLVRSWKEFTQGNGIADICDS